MQTERRIRAQAAEHAATRGNFIDAREQVIDLISEDWNCSEGHRAWGRILQIEGKYSDAISAFQTAVSLNSDDSSLQFELAAAMVQSAHTAQLSQMADWSEAHDAVLRGLEMSPGAPVGLRLLQFINEHRVLVLD